ncbi:MAG TPA: GxxExxY protein [Kofleriaceae bacterium]|nr:GxxExxY protein [Kofleriaceae bacterium]
MRTWSSRLGSIEQGDTKHTEIKDQGITIPAALEQVCFATIGTAIEVHRELGPGFLESVYEEAMAIELATRSIRFERQVAVPVMYKGHVVANHRLDLLIDSCVIVELKAVTALEPVHAAQVISYLKATGVQVGLLVNFNVPLLKNGIRRFVWDL